jgi:hypothetical protein
MSSKTLDADAIEIRRVLQRIHADAKRSNVFVNGTSAPGAATGTTTDTVNYQTALDWTWTEPPDGVYVIRANFSLVTGHSTGGLMDLKALCDQADTQPAVQSITQTQTTRSMRQQITYTFVDVLVSGGAGVTFHLQFKANAAGTVSVVNPAIDAEAVRVG